MVEEKERAIVSNGFKEFLFEILLKYFKNNSPMKTTKLLRFQAIENVSSSAYTSDVIEIFRNICRTLSFDNGYLIYEFMSPTKIKRKYANKSFFDLEFSFLFALTLFCFSSRVCIAPTALPTACRMA